MPETFLEKHASIEATRRDDDERHDSDIPENDGCFGFVRGSARDHIPMLELRKKTGTILAIGYGYVERILFDPSEGITLHALGRTIRIKGRYLNANESPSGQLFRGIARQRVAWIREVERTIGADRDNRVAIVEAIEW